MCTIETRWNTKYELAVKTRYKEIEGTKQTLNEPSLSCNNSCTDRTCLVSVLLLLLYIEKV